MNLHRRLIAVSFLESFATICVERVGYFFTDGDLHFTPNENLLLAFGFGSLYMAGAILCNRASRIVGEKRLLVAMLVFQALANVLLMCMGKTPWVFVVTMIMLGCSYGLKWPVIESFVAAGHTPASSAKAVGQFNISWAAAVPLSLLVTGPLLKYCWPVLFVLPIIASVANIWLLLPLAQRPVHLPPDHPSQPSAPQLARYKALLVSARFQMLCSYCLLWILAALLPNKLGDVGLPQWTRPGFSGLLDLVRLSGFIVLSRFTWWHNRVVPLIITLVVVPPAFALVLLPSSVGAILAGELACGLAAGLTYYAALYYAMVVKNAAVDAGGAHEGLIGLGFAVGPLAALAGSWLSIHVELNQWQGVFAGAVPVILLCSLAGLWPLLRMPRKRELM